jgi:hypothetical protein
LAAKARTRSYIRDKLLNYVQSIRMVRNSGIPYD